MKQLPPTKLTDDECTCVCHTTGAIHIMACCHGPCEYCNRKIKRTVPLETHMQRCPKKPRHQPNGP